MVQSITLNLELEWYLRTADTVGWTLCIARQHGSVSYLSNKIQYLHNTEISFKLFQQSVYLGLVFFIDILCIQTGTDPYLGFLFPPLCLAFSLRSFKSSVLRCGICFITHCEKYILALTQCLSSRGISASKETKGECYTATAASTWYYNVTCR